MLTLEHDLVRAYSVLTRRPFLVGAGEAVPVGALLGEAARGEERAGGYDSEPFIVYWERRSHRLFLSVLEAIDIFWDAWVLGPQAKGGREEGDDVGGLKSAAAALEARERVAEGHLVV